MDLESTEISDLPAAQELPDTGKVPGKRSNGQHEGRVFGLPELLHALQAVRVGDFSVRLPGDQTGLKGKIADAFNEIVAANERMAEQLEHVGEVVGREGKTRTRVEELPDVCRRPARVLAAKPRWRLDRPERRAGCRLKPQEF